MAGAAHHRCAHSLHHIFVSFAAGLGVMLAPVKRVELFALHLTHHMRHVIIAAVGDSCAKIGYLQGRQVHLALPNGDGDDGKSVPRTLVCLVVKGGVGYQSALFAGQIHAKLIAKAHAHHVIAPCVHGLLHVVVASSVANHVEQSPTKIAVARGTKGLNEVGGSRMWVASHVQTAVIKAACARIKGVFVDNPLGHVG